jgi:large subunit ribosomal protein L25
MAEIASLTVEKRNDAGSSATKRLRAAGRVPGVVYGKDADPVAFSALVEDIDSLIQSGHKVLEITVDGTTHTTLLKDVQWNTWATEVQHIDLMRVDPNKRVTVEVPVELRGVAPGVLAGGRLDQSLHSISIDCPAISLPDHITVGINDLEIGDAVHVSDLELDPKITVNTPDESPIVRIVAPVEEEELEEAEAAAVAEPEVIGRKEEAGEGETD